MSEQRIVFAATDVGSNATKTSIWRISNCHPQPVQQSRYPLRLAEAFVGQRFEPETIERLVEVFLRIADTLKEHGVTHHRAVATDAFRVAHNCDDVVNTIERRSGIRPEVLTPRQEGWLVACGVFLDFSSDDEERLIVDIGGGSAEIILADRSKKVHTLSLPLGAVRLRERFIHTDPIAPADFEAMREYCDETIGKRIARVRERWNCAVGCGGGVRFLHTMCGVFRSTLIQDQPLRRDHLEHLCEAIWPQRTESLVKQFGIDLERAEIIVPGAVVLLALMKRLGLSAIRPSYRGVRDGLLVELLRSLR